MKNKYLLIVLMAFPFFAFANEVNPYSEFRVKTYNIQEQYLERIVEHQESVMTDLELKLHQQKWQTTAVAIMVFIMVGLGLILSYMQFKRDGKEGEKSAVTLKVGSGSMEITSPVIGLVILAMSFWFFQTYIDHIYDVKVFNIAPIDITTFGVNR